MRADEAMGVGNRVQPGDFVDVFVVLKSDGRDIERGQARLILSRKRALAFGAASVEHMPSRPTDGTSPAPGQAQAHNRAEAARSAKESAGHLLLALCNPGDAAPVDPALFAGTAAAYFAAGAGSNAGTVPALVARSPGSRPDAAAPPVRPTPASRANEVELIRGDLRATLTY